MKSMDEICQLTNDFKKNHKMIIKTVILRSNRLLLNTTNIFHGQCAKTQFLLFNRSFITYPKVQSCYPTNNNFLLINNGQIDQLSKRYQSNQNKPDLKELELQEFSQPQTNENKQYLKETAQPGLKELELQEFSQPQDNKNKQDLKETAQPLTKAQKLKKAVKDYGSTVIVFHVGISLISLGSSYLLVSSGLDVGQALMTLGLGEYSAITTSAGTFAVAYALHKVFAPVRMSITLASVPFIVRYLRNKGILKK